MLHKLLTAIFMLTFAAALVRPPASAMSYLTPTNVVAACTIASAAEQTVLADEALTNQIAGKQVIRTGTTSTIANLTPTLCSQIGGVVTSVAAAALVNAPTLTAPAK